MKNLSPRFMIATLSIATAVSVVSPHACAEEPHGENSTVRKAVATAPIQHSADHEPRSANGGSWAPGGAGAWNWLYVNGSGLNVTTATVAYVPGTDLKDKNACVDQFEIAYYKDGRRVTESGSSNCAFGRATHTFHLNKNLDANTSFCGRVRIGNSWGNYACVDIKP
ncbi:hypothetical protein L1O03_01050 [Corynebacterium uropygiale]|uniref:Secreted protein n=1 Tax=Corynebacterium uropygiale TaxID=1775911 RepID=A0A9X1TYF4_9CORY|nr:hypothetical protein [Corynebacterium uropygiale]MCF4005766.1 hypothetical protein [Corynebacterium uropygiale]